MATADRPTLPPPGPRDNDTPTLIPCVACQGNYVTECRDQERPGHFSTVFCRWCTHGAMAPEQIERWAAWRKQTRLRLPRHWRAGMRDRDMKKKPIAVGDVVAFMVDTTLGFGVATIAGADDWWAVFSAMRSPAMASTHSFHEKHLMPIRVSSRHISDLKENDIVRCDVIRKNRMGGPHDRLYGMATLHMSPTMPDRSASPITPVMRALYDDEPDEQHVQFFTSGYPYSTEEICSYKSKRGVAMHVWELEPISTCTIMEFDLVE